MLYYSSQLFRELINENGYTTYHVHDGWVMDNNLNRGEILHNENLIIYWFEEHYGICPNIGDKIVVINSIPNIERKKHKPFDMYCYIVTNKKMVITYEIDIKRIDKKKVIFNAKENKYNLLKK